MAGVQPRHLHPELSQAHRPEDPAPASHVRRERSAQGRDNAGTAAAAAALGGNHGDAGNGTVVGVSAGSK